MNGKPPPSRPAAARSPVQRFVRHRDARPRLPAGALTAAVIRDSAQLPLAAISSSTRQQVGTDAAGPNNRKSLITWAPSVIAQAKLPLASPPRMRHDARAVRSDFQAPESPYECSSIWPG